MSTPARAVVVGLGIHGKGIAQGLLDAGGVLVGAVDPGYVGQDLGELLERPAVAGLTVQRSVTELPNHVEADISLVAAKLAVSPLVELLKDLVRRGTDVLTIVEDAFDLATLTPSLHSDLDRTARDQGRTVVATGVQDAAWTGVVAHMTGTQRNLRGVHIHQHLGVDGYPREFVEWLGIGLDAESFERAAAQANAAPSVLGAVLPVLAGHLGLTVADEKRQISPYTVADPVESVTLDRTIEPGEPVGQRDVVTVRTEEGVDLVAELVTSAINGRDDFRAVLDGDPRVEVNHSITPGPLAVDGTLLNRIPDILAAPPGVLLTTQLPAPRYRRRLELDD